jgi:hypothetical protein
MNTIPEQSSSAAQGSPAQSGFDSADGIATRPVGITDATRLLELAGHDLAVASTCIGLGDLDEAHTNVLTARVAADAVEEILRMLIEGHGPSRTAEP